MKLALVSATQTNREPLKAAIAARDLAVQAVVEKRATLERLQAVIYASDDAARAASAATRQANEARTAWVRGGCTYSGARELQQLEDVAAEAARAAARAAVNAKAVSLELARAEDQARSAQFGVGHCETAISREIGMIIAHEATALRDRYVRLAEELRQVRIELKAIDQLLDPTTGENAGADSPEGHRLIHSAILRGVVRPWDVEKSEYTEGGEPVRDKLNERIAFWAARASQLRKDPES